MFAAHDIKIPAKGKALVKTDIAVSFPQNCYARLAPRSGLAWKYHLDIGAGVIDSDYRGNIGVVVFNHSDNDFKVEKHMRIAQMILERYEHNCKICEVTDIDNTKRNTKGFGSSGL